MSQFNISPPFHPLRGAIRVPADKSVSHRAAILSALADGTTRVENFLESATTCATVDCLRQLGAEIEQPAPGTLIVHGKGLRGLQEPRDVLFCAGSGTTMRLVAGICAGQDFLSILDGTPALKRRPMARVIEPLREMGAQMWGRENDKYPPLAIRGAAHLRGIDYAMPVASAQVKSAILLAALFADSPITLREPAPSRDHTERMLRAFGARSEIRDWRLEIRPISNLQSPVSIHIPGDFSSAAFLVAIGLLIPNSEIRLERVGVNPTRTGLLDALAAMGAGIKIENTREEGGEPVGDLVIRGVGNLRATRVDGALVPRMIDEFPILAVVATQARGETMVADAAELRVKESDRVATVVSELRKMGAQMDERADGFGVAGPTRLRGARVSSHDDHRLAMALAVAGLIAQGETVVEGWECVADSFPGFAEILSQVAGITPQA